MKGNFKEKFKETHICRDKIDRYSQGNKKLSLLGRVHMSMDTTHLHFHQYSIIYSFKSTQRQ